MSARVGFFVDFSRGRWRTEAKKARERDGMSEFVGILALYRSVVVGKTKKREQEPELEGGATGKSRNWSNLPASAGTRGGKRRKEAKEAECAV